MQLWWREKKVNPPSLAKDYAEINNLRAFLKQANVDHGGNRTHAYHAQKWTVYPPRYTSSHT